MRFDVLTIFPGMFYGHLEEGMLGRAVKRGLVDVRLVNIRYFAAGAHSYRDHCRGDGRGSRGKRALFRAFCHRHSFVCDKFRH